MSEPPPAMPMGVVPLLSSVKITIWRQGGASPSPCPRRATDISNYDSASGSWLLVQGWSLPQAVFAENNDIMIAERKSDSPGGQTQSNCFRDALAACKTWA